MRMLFLALLMALAITDAVAKRNNLKPADFEPLTSLPWKQKGAKLEGVLDAIFREPNIAIRYPVLAEYLRTIPVNQLGKAFDICIELEDMQTPNDLVAFFLPIWAKRDPKACWKRTKELFRVVGIEYGWLDYDGWEKRARITVQDLAAIRASRFWLRSFALVTFPLGVNASSLPKIQRVSIMKDFAEKWFDAFGTWPGVEPRGFYSDDSYQLMRVFDLPENQLHNHFGDRLESRDEAAFEIVMRRWLQLEPASVVEIMKKVQQTKLPPYAGQTDLRPTGPSSELFMIWAKVDLPGMIRWTESLDLGQDDLGSKARGFLMSRVDAETRERWLANAKSGNEEDNLLTKLLAQWAEWDPKPALESAAKTNDPNAILEAASGTADGPWGFSVSHSGFAVIKDFDVTKLPDEVRLAIKQNWSQFVVEPWGEIDVSEAARYGLWFMLATNFAPRDRLMRFFSGHDEYPDEGDMIDRTFCALRVWAVVKPKEMKAWIATLDDAEMCKALTWLLQHPWGMGPKD